MYEAGTSGRIDDHVLGGLPDDAAHSHSDSSGPCRNSDAAAHDDSAACQHSNIYAVTISVSITAANVLTHYDAHVDAFFHSLTDRYIDSGYA